MTAASRPSDDWRDATRRRLMAVAADEGIGATARHRASAIVPDAAGPPVLDEMFPRRPRGGRRLAIVAALLTGTVAVSGVSAASGHALPGETLYNVKRSTERAQLALVGNDLGRGQLHLEFAGNRIQEATALAEDEDAAAGALTDAANELRSGAVLLGELAVANDDAVPLDYIDLFGGEHRWTLETLVAELDGEARVAGDELTALLDRAALRSVELRAALGCTEVGGATDELGPVPGGCGAREAVEPTEPPTQSPTGTPRGDENRQGDSGDESTSDRSEPAVDGIDSPDVDVSGTTTPAADAATDPATGEVTGDQDDGDDDNVLDELSGVVEDLFG
ncbi:DUF5667 domain-containing protein [Glycomyces sp. L485]|uniref:DUF5667 domain-containing protein n=1 Tax=Glycomyces sp. L485 TaxID=2909235 RepID=UPI001F4AA1A0|nr:DUF5667 domain-containing protein [Glycomyces sp. L485]MCH7232766.1 DUF5667 domain-containing protein [Glycomyces sp. L485]